MVEKLSATRAEGLMLLRHGTQPARLKPSAIIHAARSDLRRREANRALRRLRKGGMPARDTGTLHPYAFDPRHLSKAKTPADVIRMAIAEVGRGMASSDISRVRIYSDIDLLYEALVIAESEDA